MASLVLPYVAAAGPARGQERGEHRQEQRSDGRRQEGHREGQRPVERGRQEQRHFGRVPIHNDRDARAYRRLYEHRPEFRSYGVYYGLAPGLAAFPALGFLADGLLVGSYVDEGQMVYVYVVQEDGVNREYRVTNQGQILSVRIVP